ncbi:hypothetical protein HJFPF1_00632 [Paramyrothecium foliicola]|nr:hypothetical protein HJFPF1_00632 [Paramyrothecium foliicola]
MFHHIGAAVVKRAIHGGNDGNGDNGPVYELPAWSYLFLVFDLLIFIPLFIFVKYTVSDVFPVFAIVEDEKPPAYEPVALQDDYTEEPGQQTQNVAKPTAGDAKAVSSSIRAMTRLLRANGGFKALFRGFFCLITQELCTIALLSIFIGAFGGLFAPVATLLASLTLIQLSTAWVHIVLTKRSELHFWQRLPPFKRTFEATWRAVLLHWGANEVARWLPDLLAALIGLDMPDIQLRQPTRVHEFDGSHAGKVVAVLAVAVVSAVFIVIPARVVLHRVQASLLSPEAETIIPFDRTFDGRVDPVVVSGKGYATIADAWSTFTKAAWRRLVFLYIKIAMVTFGAFVFMLLLSVPQGFIVALFTTKVDDSTGDL